MCQHLFKITACFVLSLAFCACGSDKDKSGSAANRQDTLAETLTELAPVFSSETGAAGVFDVPEMLTLCKLDSAPAKEVPAKIKADFADLEEDLRESGAQVFGPQGMILYNNQYDNFKFECVIPIKALPAKAPQHSKVTVLEADRMLIYNYYGPYETSYKAYEEIRLYLKEHHLKQSGPLREFYPSDPNEPDTAKWLTRMMVPVMGERDELLLKSDSVAKSGHSK